MINSIKLKFNLKTFLLLLALTGFNTLSGNVNLDSLKKQMRVLTGEELISSLCFLGEDLLDSIPEESFHYFKRADRIADSLQNPNGKKQSLYALGNYYKTSGAFNVAKNYFDSSIHLTQPEDYQHRILILIGYGEIEYEILHYDSAIFYLEKAKKLAEMKDVPDVLSAVYNNLARVHDKLGNRDEANEYYL